jgi:hypothetical protein
MLTPCQLTPTESGSSPMHAVACWNPPFSLFFPPNHVRTDLEIKSSSSSSPLRCGAKSPINSGRFYSNLICRLQEYPNPNDSLYTLICCFSKQLEHGGARGDHEEDLQPLLGARGTREAPLIIAQARRRKPAIAHQHRRRLEPQVT